MSAFPSMFPGRKLYTIGLLIQSIPIKFNSGGNETSPLYFVIRVTSAVYDSGMMNSLLQIKEEHFRWR